MSTTLTSLIVHVVRKFCLRVYVTDPQASCRSRLLCVVPRIHTRVHLLNFDPSFSVLFPTQQLHYCVVPRIFGVFYGGVGVVVLSLKRVPIQAQNEDDGCKHEDR